MTIYLADSSALRFIWQDDRVPERLESLASAGSLFAWCTPTRDELLFSTRTSAEADTLLNRLGSSLVFLPMRPGAEEIALSIRLRLTRAGHGRAAGLTGVLMAAVAIDHSATVLHYNPVYEAIASAEPRLQHEWVLPEGTAPDSPIK